MKTTSEYDHIWNDKNLIAETVKNSKSMRQTLVNLGIEPSSKRYTKLKNQCLSFGIELVFDNPKASDRRFSDEIVFTSPSVFGRNNGKELKTRALNLGYVENICVLCGIKDEWNGLPLSLHLDHIDGDHKNNNPNNLRMLCPNCHTQTDTYGYRNHKKTKCINGHPWIKENLRKHPSGWRCITCAETWSKNTRWKEKERNGWTPND